MEQLSLKVWDLIREIYFFFNLRMEQITLKNENNCLNINIYFYLETTGGESSNLFLNVVHFLNTSVN
jgi:hypothetical protein